MKISSLAFLSLMLGSLGHASAPVPGMSPVVENLELIQKVPGKAEGIVPTPQMAMGLDMGRDTTEWRLAGTPEGSRVSILSEMIPVGDSVESWEEMVTSIVVFGQGLDIYCDNWTKSLEEAGAKITENTTLPDGSRWVRYNASGENGSWRFIQGPDAIYGISYQTRPHWEEPERLELWESILKTAHLGRNPVKD
jgi:hypothetical protein